MGKIIFGLACLFIKFNVTIGSFSFELIPNFIGYILIVLGLKNKESKRIKKIKIVSKIAFVYTFMTYILNIYGLISPDIMNVFYIIDLIIMVYILSNLTKHIYELEVKSKRDLKSINLFVFLDVIIITAIGKYLYLNDYTFINPHNFDINNTISIIMIVLEMFYLVSFINSYIQIEIYEDDIRKIKIKDNLININDKFLLVIALVSLVIYSVYKNVDISGPFPPGFNISGAGVSSSVIESTQTVYTNKIINDLILYDSYDKSGIEGYYYSLSEKGTKIKVGDITEKSILNKDYYYSSYKDKEKMKTTLFKAKATKEGNTYYFYAKDNKNNYSKYLKIILKYNKDQNGVMIKKS